MIIGIIGIIALGGIIAVILFLLWQQRRFRPQQPGVSAPSQPAKTDEQILRARSFLAGAIIIAVIIALFPKQVGQLVVEKPIYVVILALIVLVQTFYSDKQKFIKKIKTITMYIGACIAGVLILWPATETNIPALHLKEVREVIFPPPPPDNLPIKPKNNAKDKPAPTQTPIQSQYDWSRAQSYPAVEVARVKNLRKQISLTIMGISLSLRN